MGDLSDHFDRREFVCHGSQTPGHPSHPLIVSPTLVARLERLRGSVGKPLRIVSGHRCLWWNYRVKGAKLSRHVRGDAADIPAGYATVAQAEAAGFDGIGRKGVWAVHVDTRGYRARWRY